MSNRYARILHALHTTPLAILPAKLAEVRHFLHLRAKGGKVKKEEVRELIDARRLPSAYNQRQADAVDGLLAGRRDDGVQMAGRVAVIPCFGTICHHAGSMDEA